MQNNNLNNKDTIFQNLPEKVEYLNSLLLSTSWANVEFDSPELKAGLNFDNNIFTDKQKEFLELFISLVPEWKRVIGCKQHNTHTYCLDIHILLVVKKIMDQEEFYKLNDYYKSVLLWGAMLHDIEKCANVVDPSHPLKGAEKAYQILTRLKLDQNFINDVYLLVKHHPIIGFMSLNKLNLNMNDIVDKIDNEKFFELFIIFAIADIKAVQSNDAIYNDKIDHNIKYIYREVKNYYRKLADKF